MVDFIEVKDALKAEIGGRVREYNGMFVEKALAQQRANSLGFTLHPKSEAKLEEMEIFFKHRRICPETGVRQYKLVGMVMRPKPENIDLILKRASTDPEWLDAAQFIAASNLAYGVPMPEALSKFAIGVLVGDIIRPTVKGRKKRSYRTLLVIRWVEEAVRMGLRPTRNDVSCADSACDAVAYATRENGLQPSSFSGVKAIWLRRGLEIDRNIEP